MLCKRLWPWRANLAARRRDLYSVMFAYFLYRCLYCCIRKRMVLSADCLFPPPLCVSAPPCSMESTPASLPSRSSLRRRVELERCAADTISTETALSLVFSVYVVLLLVTASWMNANIAVAETISPVDRIAYASLLLTATPALALAAIGIKRRRASLLYPFFGLQLATLGSVAALLVCCTSLPSTAPLALYPSAIFDYALRVLGSLAVAVGAVGIVAFGISVTRQAQFFFSHPFYRRTGGNIEIFANPMFEEPPLLKKTGGFESMVPRSSFADAEAVFTARTNHAVVPALAALFDDEMPEDEEAPPTRPSKEAPPTESSLKVADISAAEEASIFVSYAKKVLN